MPQSAGSHLAVAVLSRTSFAGEPLFVEVVPSATELLTEKLLGLAARSKERPERTSPHALVLSPPPAAQSWVPSLSIIGGVSTSNRGYNRDTRYAAWIRGFPAAVALTEADILSQAHHYATAEWRDHPAANRNPIGSGIDRDGEWLAARAAVESVAASLQRSHNDLGDSSTLDDLLWRMEREELQLRGVVHTLQRAESRIDPRDLDLSFGYHQGVQHTTLCFHDTSTEMLRAFLPSNVPATLGSKVLCPYGVAAVVGVAHDALLDSPCLFWHPAGSPAALAAPVFHSCRLLSVGHCVMEPHGPAPRSPLMHPEELSRYLNVAVAGDGVESLDRTEWINVGLFGRPVGTVLNKDLRLLPNHASSAALSADVICSRRLTVVGARWNRVRNAIEQMAADERSGQLVRLPMPMI